MVIHETLVFKESMYLLGTLLKFCALLKFCFGYTQLFFFEITVRAFVLAREVIIHLTGHIVVWITFLLHLPGA